VAVGIGQAEIAAAVAVGGLVKIDAELVQIEGPQVVNGAGVFDGPLSDIVATTAGRLQPRIDSIA